MTNYMKPVTLGLAGNGSVVYSTGANIKELLESKQSSNVDYDAQKKAIQAKKDAKADAKARLEARNRAHQNKKGYITFKDPATGKYTSGTPADLSAARRNAQHDAVQARKGFKGHVTEVSPYDGSKQPVTPETAEWWRSQKKVVKDNPQPGPKPTSALTPQPNPKPTPNSTPVPTPQPNPKSTPNSTPVPTPQPGSKAAPSPKPSTKTLPAPIPGPKSTPKPKPGFLSKIGKFAKKLGKWGIPLLLLGGAAALLLKNCKGCSNTTPVAPTPNDKDCKASVKEDIKEQEIKNIAYKMQDGDRFDKVIEAKYGITDPSENKKVREYIREQMGMPKSGQDENGKTIIPRIEQDGKTLYDAYFLPEQLPEELGGAKYQDNPVKKSQYKKGDCVSKEAQNTSRTEKTSDGFSVITTCKKADGTEESSVQASGLTEEEANEIADELNNAA